MPYRSCIALDARSWSLRTSKWTWHAYFVKYIASSVAVSPPPTTARTWPLYRGDAPSHIAHALIPLLQNSSSRGNLSRFAVAPVAMITLWDFTYICATKISAAKNICRIIHVHYKLKQVVCHQHTYTKKNCSTTKSKVINVEQKSRQRPK